MMSIYNTKLCLIIFLVSMIISPQLQANSTTTSKQIHIKGKVHFWTKTDLLPVPISEPFIIDTWLKAPSYPYKISIWSTIITYDNIFAHIKVFWSHIDSSNHYVVFQTKIWLKDKNNDMINISECSQYTQDNTEVVFVAGACSGFWDEGDYNVKQIGLSFLKK